MEAIYLLIPLAAVLVAVIVVGFFWAVKSGQFDDLEGPAWSILMDDDDSLPGPAPDTDGEATPDGRVDATQSDRRNNDGD